MALFGCAHRLAERHRTYRTLDQATFNARFLLDRCHVRVWYRNLLLSFFPIPGRYVLNWYAGKLFSLLSSSVVLFVLLYEITALYTRLQDALRAAKQADRAKSIFRDAELRTMLVGISRSVDTMNGMLTNLLDFRLELGTLAPSINTFPINDIFDFVAADFLGALGRKLEITGRSIRDYYP